MEVDWKTAVTVPGYEIRPLTLRFANAEFERQFAFDHLDRAIVSIRIFLLAGAVLYALFGFLDAAVLPQTRNTIWMIRYLGVTPVLIGVYALTYSSIFKHVSQFALGMAMFSAGLGIIAMTAVAEAPGNALYYAGLIMVVSYCLNLIRLRWTNAAFLAILLTLLYQPVALWINPIEPQLVLSNNFFLVMSTGVGIFSSYVHELYIRRDYLHAEMLKLEKKRTDELLEESQSASRAKSEFLGIMSHELRTPLNAILGFAEIMQQRMFGPVGSERYAGYVDDIHSAAEHLLNIISDVLDLSKAEVGKLVLEEEDVDIVELLESCLRLLREQAGEGGIRLSIDLPQNRPILRVDSRLIKQVAINLLGNAIKFTQNGGSVNVSFGSDSDGRFLINFKDSGIGIAKGNLEKVMEPFVQVEGAFARKHGGTGLGLPLVKRITELHDGKVVLDSELGVGTTVTIALPASRVVNAPAAAPKAAE